MSKLPNTEDGGVKKLKPEEGEDSDSPNETSKVPAADEQKEEQSKDSGSKVPPVEKEPDSTTIQVEIPENNLSVADVMKGSKVKGDKRDTIVTNVESMLSSLPTEKSIFKPAMPTYPWMWKDADTFEHSIDKVHITEFHSTVYYTLKNDVIGGPWTEPVAFFVDLLESAAKLANRLIGIPNTLRRVTRSELGRNLPTVETGLAWHKPSFRSQIEDNVPLRRAWDARYVSKDIELKEIGKSGLGAGRPGDGLTVKRWEYETMTPFQELYSPLDSVKPEQLIAKYIKTPLMARRMLEPYQTRFHAPTTTRLIDMESFFLLSPRVGGGVITTIARQSPTFVNKIFDLIMSITNIVEVGTTERFQENQEITRTLAQRVNEIMSTSSLGTQITSVNSDRVFKTLGVMSIIGGGMEVRFDIPRPEVRDPTTLIGCLSYLALTPDNLLNLGDAQRALQYIFIHYHARHEKPKKRGKTGYTEVKYMPYEEDRLKPTGGTRKSVTTQFTADLLESEFGFIDGGYDYYEDYLDALDPNGAVYRFFNQLTEVRPINGHPPPVGYPDMVDGVKQFYPFKALDGRDEFTGRWGILVNYIRTMRELPLSMDDSGQARMYKSLTRIFVNRAAIPTNYMTGLTRVINTILPLGLNIGDVPERIPIDMKPTDMISLLYTVDMKTLLIGSGIYDFVFWANGLRSDFETYVSLSTMVHQRFANLRDGSERRAILTRLLKLCDDFFSVPESRAFFPFLLHEFSPPLNDGNVAVYTSIFSDAINECEGRIRDYLPYLGYESQLIYEGEVSDSRDLDDLKAANFVGENRRTGLDYVIVSKGVEADGSISDGYKAYDRRDLRTFKEELTSKGVITYDPRALGAYAPQLSDNFPFIKWDVQFDTPEQSKDISDNEDAMFDKISTTNSTHQMMVRVRDNDKSVGLVRRIKHKGHTFMIPDRHFNKKLLRLDPEEFGEGTHLIVWTFDPSKILKSIEIETKAVPTRF